MNSCGEASVKLALSRSWEMNGSEKRGSHYTYFPIKIMEKQAPAIDGTLNTISNGSSADLGFSFPRHEKEDPEMAKMPVKNPGLWQTYSPIASPPAAETCALPINYWDCSVVSHLRRGTRRQIFLDGVLVHPCLGLLQSMATFVEGDPLPIIMKRSMEDIARREGLSFS